MPDQTTPEDVRDALLNSGRIAGRGFISVRGDDLVTAIETGPPAKKTTGRTELRGVPDPPDLTTGDSPAPRRRKKHEPESPDERAS